MQEGACTGFHEVERRTHLNTHDEGIEQKPVSPCTNDDTDGISEGDKDEQGKEYDDFDENIGDEQGQEAKIMKGPDEPTRDELEKHMTTHMPFRSWCPYCVQCKAKNNAHKKRKAGEHEVPVIVSITCTCTPRLT